jgi:predicted metal-binding membrane protein
VSSTPDLTGRLLRRQRLVVACGVALLVFLSWLFLVGGAAVDGVGMNMRPPLGALVVMWWVMMAAMMLPSATPAILLYGQVRATRGRDAAIADSWVFLFGYLAVWLIFSLAAATAQWLLSDAIRFGSRWASAAMLIAAGMYQFSPLKTACVRECRSPAQFISRHWRGGWFGAVRLGVMHGAYCVGCCWLLMALLFVGGIMNLLWVAGLTIIVAIEKLAPRGAIFGRAAGGALIAWGLVKLAGY